MSAILEVKWKQDEVRWSEAFLLLPLLFSAGSKREKREGFVLSEASLGSFKNLWPKVVQKSTRNSARIVS